MDETYIHWVVTEIWEDGATTSVFRDQAEALKRYMKSPRATLLYELQVGKEPAIIEHLRKEAVDEA